jgi:hypothetical protein
MAQQSTSIKQAALASPVRDFQNVEEEEVQVQVVAKAINRPELLTLGGVYSTTKSLYRTYIPDSAAKIIQSVTESLFKASSPLIVKVIPDSASKEWKCLETGELETVDTLFTSYCTAGDAVIDTFLIDAKDRATEIYTVQKEKVTTKVYSWVDSLVMLKNYLYEKVEDVKPELQSKLDVAKSAVQSKLEDEKVVAILDQAKPYINLVKENVDPAKEIISEMATTVKAEVEAKGYIGYAKQSAGSIREQGLEAFETCKTLGAVEGVKEISNQVMSNMANKLEDAKRRKQTLVVAGEVEGQVEEFTSGEEDAN